MTKKSKTTKTSGTKPQIVFFGSGPVAAKSLELLADHCEIEAVITKPKPPHHRGDFPVLDTAEKLGLTVYTVSNKRELDELMAKKPVQSRLGVLIDFGIIVSKTTIDYFPLGIINSHFSILPEWRGADPITFAILSGQKTTGVSLMLLVEAMDEGPLLAQSTYEIPAQATVGELTEDLIHLSDGALRQIIPLYIDGQTIAMPQEQVTLADSKEPTYSRKLTKDDGIIDWNKPAEQLEREIRAFLDWPKSRATLADKDVVITKGHVINEQGTPGEVTAKDKQIIVFCGEKALGIDELIPAGKNKMTGEAFLAGHRHLL